MIGHKSNIYCKETLILVWLKFYVESDKVIHQAIP